ncbi:CRTAC1 family protein [Aureliella helgolandensis]|uniref:FG-GAP repeat protein n=1 Tax=Aureliella helgolandensis TaxID=2527968 RepID=A0A518G9W5_9BACT|nr:CRTAC1 family protein [Aureliella helgolandensis]QDV25372.1 FG-GAP repeat protein [Aureliella helgolandensis]
MNCRLTCCLLLTGLVLTTGSSLDAKNPTTTIRLQPLLAEQTGIVGLHSDGSSGQHYLVEAVASGMASFDYDGDGYLDLYFLSGGALKGADPSRVQPNRLYRNQGDWTFVDVTEQSGLGSLSHSLGVSVGDVNEDGCPDVYVNNYGRNELFLNCSDGRFVQSASQVTQCGSKVGAGVSMLDMDGDGDLDIYVANYIVFDYDLREPSKFQGKVVYGGPVLYPAEPDDLLRNNGDGTFTNVSQSSGIGLDAEWGMGTVCFDADADGDTDIFVANDSTRNFLWENDGHGIFTEIALLGGVAYDYQGEPQGSMGADVSDYNGDGTLDLFVTSYENQSTTLYENLGSAIFQDITLSVGAGANTDRRVNWGTAFADLDNDQDQDLVLANGHIHDNLDEFDDTTSYRIHNQVFENEAGRFTDCSMDCGIATVAKESSRGLVVEDLDRDGRPDLVVLNIRTVPTLFKNSSAENNWIELDLIGIQASRSAVGTKVMAVHEGREQIRELLSGRGYQSHFGTRLHFGLGTSARLERLEIQWYGGDREVFHDLEANGLYTIRQGLGIERQPSPPAVAP